MTEEIIIEMKILNRRRLDAIKASARLQNQIQSIIRNTYIPENYESLSEDELHKVITEFGQKYWTKNKSKFIKGHAPEEPLIEDSVGHLIRAWAIIDPVKDKYDKSLAKQYRKLPVYQFTKDVRGLGDVACAKIVAGVGDISKFKRPKSLMQFCGLGVVDGKAQRSLKGTEAMNNGYSRQIRTDVFAMTANGMGMLNHIATTVKDDAGKQIVDERGDTIWTVKGDSIYGQYFVNKLNHERDKLRNEDGLLLDGKKKLAGHAKMRAERKLQGRVLTDMWLSWRYMNEGDHFIDYDQWVPEFIRQGREVALAA